MFYFSISRVRQLFRTLLVSQYLGFKNAILYKCSLLQIASMRMQFLEVVCGISFSAGKFVFGLSLSLGFTRCYLERHSFWNREREQEPRSTRERLGTRYMMGEKHILKQKYTKMILFFFALRNCF